MVKEALTNAETYFMKAIWTYEGDIPVIKMMEIMRDEFDRDYQRTTVATFLTKLIAKGYITTYKIRKLSYVRPEISLREYCEFVSATQTNLWFGKSPAKYLASYNAKEGLTAEDIAEIRELLDSLEA